MECGRGHLQERAGLPDGCIDSGVLWQIYSGGNHFREQSSVEQELYHLPVGPEYDSYREAAEQLREMPFLKKLVGRSGQQADAEF